MGKLLICDPVDESAIEEMRQAGVDVDVRDDISPEALADVIGDYEGIVVRSRTKVPGDLIDKATKLKVIIRGGVGLDSIDVAHAQEKGIAVRNTPESNSNAVVELVLGLMISLARSIPDANQAMKEGRWTKKSLQGTELEGKTLGIIGYGRIGQMLGQKAEALGMRVVGCDPYINDTDLLCLEDLLAASDYISMHVPGGAATKNLLNAENLARTKQGVFIIQASRGGTVAEEALYEALVSGHVAGAALDVYTEEPPKSDLLRNLVALPQVIATPHIGAATEEALTRVGGEVAKLAISYLA
jgi:D-3-phosphoglycerate dehydrogenase